MAHRDAIGHGDRVETTRHAAALLHPATRRVGLGVERGVARRAVIPGAGKRHERPGNLFLGRELRTATGALDDSAMASATRDVLKRLNPRFKNLNTPVRSLSGGQRQSVAIARAVHFNAKILIMDEPTAALGPAETEQVRELITQLKSEGIGIFLISHDIHDVFDLADRISVMMQGRLVGTVDKDKVTKDEVLGMIIMGKKPASAG